MDSSSELASLFNNLDQAAMLELIISGALLLIIASQRGLPWLANRLHGSFRHFLLASVPLVRLLLFVAALLLAMPVIMARLWTWACGLSHWSRWMMITSQYRT
ncbi:MAG: hypothetical protein ABR522_07155 [Marinobacter sp.]